LKVPRACCLCMSLAHSSTLDAGKCSPEVDACGERRQTGRRKTNRRDNMQQREKMGGASKAATPPLFCGSRARAAHNPSSSRADRISVCKVRVRGGGSGMEVGNGKVRPPTGRPPETGRVPLPQNRESFYWGENKSGGVHEPLAGLRPLLVRLALHGIA
jgi:hypothetical protein